MAAQSKTGTVTDEPSRADVAAAAGFDFDAWIGGASRPERSVTVYAANALQAEIAKLEDTRAQILAEFEEAQKHAFVDESWGAAPASPDTADVDRRIKAAQKHLAGSGHVFTVRAIDSDEEDGVFKAHPLPKDKDDPNRGRVLNDRVLGKMAVQIVGPQKFTVEQLVKLRKAVGEPEFAKLWDACLVVNGEVSASTPFWRGNSGGSPS